MESLISMSLFCLVMLASMEVFQSSRIHFTNLKRSEESNTNAYAALDKMKQDISAAGKGLITPMGHGWIKGVETSGDILFIRYADMDLSISTHLQAGQTWIPQDSTKDLKTGQEVLVFSLNTGELKIITSVETYGITIDSPLTYSYSQDNTSFLRIKKIAFYLDKKKDTLRRKVNSSPAQPLCEEVFFFSFIHDPPKNLIQIQLCLNSNKEKAYDLCVYPKNQILRAEE